LYFKETQLAVIIYLHEVLASPTWDLILGLAIAVASLAAGVAFLVLVLRNAWHVLKFLIQTTVCVLRGEQPPWLKRREEIKRMRERVLSREEAIACVQKYAEAKGYSAQDPFNIQLRFLQTEEERKEDRLIGRFIYSMNIGHLRPGTFVELDAIDGTVLKWWTPPR
jgi:hypothetical protein